MIDHATQHTSGFIYDLIDEFNIISESDLTGEQFHLFSEKYKLCSQDRDISLLRYLHTSPNIFRCHLPYSKWAVAVALSVVWYYDELVVGDPVLQILNTEGLDIEAKKMQLKRLVVFLKEIKESVDGGYLLFTGNTGSWDTNNMTIEINQILEQEQVQQAFERITGLAKKPSPINNDPADNLVQLDIQYHGLANEVRSMAQYIPQHVIDQNKLSNGIFYDFMTPFQRMTKQELIDFKKADLLDSAIKEYKNDISIILKTIADGYHMNTPVLFYRNTDYIVAQNHSLIHSDYNKKIVDTTVYDCLVPYVNGIPPERLFDIKTQIPAAFMDLRGYMFELVKKVIANTEDPETIRFLIEKDVQSKMRLLTTELENAKYKWRFHGVATPLTLLTGSLGFTAAGLDPAHIASAVLGSSGIIKMIATWSDVKSDKNKAALNPVYFLWKAQQ